MDFLAINFHMKMIKIIQVPTVRVFNRMYIFLGFAKVLALKYIELITMLIKYSDETEQESVTKISCELHICTNLFLFYKIML